MRQRINPMFKAILIASLYITSLVTVIPHSVFADARDDAVEEAVELLKERGLKDLRRLELVIEVINQDSQEFDQEARVIQSSLYSTLQSEFRKAKILLKEEAIAGISSRAIIVKCSYQRKRGKVYITLRAIKQMVAKSDANYESKEKRYKNLVVVLPFSSKYLDKDTASAFSMIFRSALMKSGQFSLVSSDAVDSADPEKIQETYKCSREECSAIVAQQLNANRVITTSYKKLSSKIYFVTASLKDISSGRTIAAERVRHDGNMENLESVLETLACKLAKTCGQPVQSIVRKPIPKPVPQVVVKPEYEPKSQENQLWDLVKDSIVIDDFKGYLKRYPNGKYKKIAELKMERLKKTKTNWPSILSFVASGGTLANYFALSNNIPGKPTCADKPSESQTDACLKSVKNWENSVDVREGELSQNAMMAAAFGILGYLLMDENEENAQQGKNQSNLLNDKQILNLSTTANGSLRLDYTLRW